MVAVSVDAETGMLMIGDSKVIITDVQATNGTIHVIDTVIMPEPEPEPALGSIVDVALASPSFGFDEGLRWSRILLSTPTPIQG
jgi:hypothetical protein